MPAAHAVPAAAALAVPHSLPADVGDVTGGRVLTAREQRLKVRDLLCASSTRQVCKL